MQRVRRLKLEAERGLVQRISRALKQRRGGDLDDGPEDETSEGKETRRGGSNEEQGEEHDEIGSDGSEADSPGVNDSGGRGRRRPRRRAKESKAAYEAVSATISAFWERAEQLARANDSASSSSSSTAPVDPVFDWDAGFGSVFDDPVVADDNPPDDRRPSTTFEPPERALTSTQGTDEPVVVPDPRATPGPENGPAQESPCITRARDVAEACGRLDAAVRSARGSSRTVFLFTHWTTGELGRPNVHRFVAAVRDPPQPLSSEEAHDDDDDDNNDAGWMVVDVDLDALRRDPDVSPFSHLSLLQPLVRVLLDASIPKVAVHGAELVVALQSIGLFLVNLFDLCVAARELGDADDAGPLNPASWQLPVFGTASALQPASLASTSTSSAAGSVRELLERAFGLYTSLRARLGAPDESAAIASPVHSLALRRVRLVSNLECLVAPPVDWVKAGADPYPRAIPPWFLRCPRCRVTGHFPIDCPLPTQ